MVALGVTHGGVRPITATPEGISSLLRRVLRRSVLPGRHKRAASYGSGAFRAKHSTQKRRADIAAAAMMWNLHKLGHARHVTCSFEGVHGALQSRDSRVASKDAQPAVHAQYRDDARIVLSARFASVGKRLKVERFWHQFLRQLSSFRQHPA